VNVFINIRGSRWGLGMHWKHDVQVSVVMILYSYELFGYVCVT